MVMPVPMVVVVVVPVVVPVSMPVPGWRAESAAEQRAAGEGDRAPLAAPSHGNRPGVTAEEPPATSPKLRGL